MVVKLGGRGPGHKSRTPPGTGGAAAITLSGLSTPETSAAGALIGSLSTVGTTGTPVFALDNNAGAKAALSGANINRGATALNADTASFFDIVVSVTGVTPSISPTTFRIGVVTAVDPARFGMPDATTTGVQAGITLTTYAGPSTIATDNALIENVIINGTLRLTGANVTVRNCVVQNWGDWGVLCDWLGATVEHCDIFGDAAFNTNAAIAGIGTFTANNIRRCENGIIFGPGSVIRDNYIHDLFDSGPDPHYDGIVCQGDVSGALIEHNTVESWDTSCIFLKADFGPINDITIRNNLLYGDLLQGVGAPSFAIYVWSATNVTIENNYIAQGAFGYTSTNGDITGLIYRNNVEWRPGIDPTPYP